MTLTELERDVLLAIYDSDFQDCRGERVIGNPVWSMDGTLNTKLAKGKQISGVISQLVQKGFIGQDGRGSRKEAVVWITRPGYDALFKE